MKKAFTLIELLVVIAIIAILAAILFPVFAQAKASAKQAVCSSNMRQLGMAGQLYLNDNDDMWFPAFTNSSQAGFAPQQSWLGYDNNNGPLSNAYYGDDDKAATGPVQPGIIDSYLKSEGVKKCPSMPGVWQLAYAINGFTSTKPSAYYITNPSAQGNEYSPCDKSERIMPGGYTISLAANNSELEEPSSTLVMWEHEAAVPLCNFLQPFDWVDSPPDIQSLRDHFHFLHRDGSNTLWGDTHVRRLVYTQLRRPMFSVRKDIFN